MENEILDYVMNTPGNTNPAILRQMLDANSGTKLPEPTPEDNGKVLGVSEGQYALVSGGGGGGSGLVVHATTVDDTETLDKTWQEIFDVMSAGGNIVIMKGETECTVETLAGYDGEEYYVGSYETESADGYPSIGGK